MEPENSQCLRRSDGKTDHMVPSGDPRIESVLFSETDIQDRVRQLAANIRGDLADCAELTVVGVLKGAFVFMADLGRELRRNGLSVRYEFIKTTTYGATLRRAGESSRDVRVDLLPTGLKGRDVLLVEDILDQGFTLSRIRDVLREHGARSVMVCVFLDKILDAPSAEVASLRAGLCPDYVGFRVADRWVAGYGLDVEEELRDLPYIAVVREELCQA